MKNSVCVHEKRKISCKTCKGSQICKHRRQRSTCAICGGGSVCSHKIQKSTCRKCDVVGWSKRYITISRQQAKRFGYCPPNTTAEKVALLVTSSKKCCACGLSLDWSKGKTCLHHSHETGEVFGFVHRFCNTVEGYLKKMGSSRASALIKNFFPDIVMRLKRKK